MKKINEKELFGKVWSAIFKGLGYALVVVFVLFCFFSGMYNLINYVYNGLPEPTHYESYDTVTMVNPGVEHTERIMQSSDESFTLEEIKEANNLCTIFFSYWEHVEVWRCQYGWDDEDYLDIHNSEELSELVNSGSIELYLKNK